MTRPKPDPTAPRPAPTLGVVTPISSIRPRIPRLAALLLSVSLVIAACGVDSGITTIDAQPTPSVPGEPTTSATAPGTTGDVEAPDVTASSPEPPPATSPPPTAPASTLPPIVEPKLKADIELAAVVDVDEGKPAREYDRFVAVALTDIARWWNEQYPAVYGVPFEPLAGGVYAGYPERESALPGCGTEPTTEYDDLRLFVAFYCEFGDFMVYDDDSVDVLLPLAQEFGPAVMGIVLAHEYGHAIQSRNGGLDRSLPTITTEQQADCFAGAWTGQAYGGESPLLRLGDRDIRAGLIAMLSVRDPVGTDQFVPGGHGSAFDRVGAFQEGFVQGPARCAELLDEPLPLMPNAFQPGSLDQALGGNAPYDCEELRDLGASEQAIADCTPAPTFLADDLNDFWVTAAGDFSPLSVDPLSDITAHSCDQVTSLAEEVLVCPEAGTVVYEEPAVLELYREFGDFTLGYFYGIAWAEVAQQRSNSVLAGEQRALLSDCYTGAWVRDITPDGAGRTPRGRDTDGDGFQDAGISSSPGDLDEAIRMAILEGDDGANVDAVGSPFEKIAAFRIGVLGGLAACDNQLG